MKIKKYFKTRKNAFLAAALTGILFYLIFESAGLLFSGTGIFLHDDLWGIYPAEYKLSLENVLKGNYSNYSFTRGMGDGGSFPFSLVLNPFCWIYVIIQDINVASVIATALKLMLAAYLFQRLCNKLLKRDNIFSIVFSCSYALCAYVLIFYHNIIFLDAFYMLPVLVWQQKKLIVDKKIAPMSIALAYQFTVHYYTGYILGVFLFAITLFGSINYCVLERKQSRFKFVLGRLGALILSAVVAAIISFASYFPSVYSTLQNNTVATEAEIEAPILENGITNGIFAFLKSFVFWNGQTQDSPIPSIYFGIITLIFSVLFFVKTKKNRVLMGALLAFLVLCTFMPHCYVIIHMFDMPDGSCYRFSYFFAFIGCLCAVEGASCLFTNKKFVLIRNIICLFVAAEIVIAGVYIEKQQDRGDYETKAIYRAWKDEVANLVAEKKAEDQGFYRFHMDKQLYENESAYFGYPSVTQFCTVINANVRKTNEFLGFFSSPKKLSGIGGTPVTRMIYGQKYSIYNERNEVKGDAYIETYDYALPIAYSVKNDFREFCLVEDNPFENQNKLLSAMTGEEIKVFSPLDSDMISIELVNMVVGYTDQNTTCLYLYEPEKEIGRIDFEVDLDLPVYMRFCHNEYANYTYDPFVVGETQMGQIETSTLHAGASMKMRTDTENQRVSIVMADGTNTYDEFIKLQAYVYHNEELEDAYNVLQPGQLEHVIYKNEVISGDIEIKSGNEVLMTTIPYHKNWHIVIDGVDVETYGVLNETFLAADVTPGHHDVEIYYSNTIDKKTIPVSVVGFVIVTVLILHEKRGKKRNEAEI